MSNRLSNQKNGVVIGALAILVLLPGCGVLDWVKDKMGGSRQASSQSADQGMITDGSLVVVSMDGKPLITQERLIKEKNDVIESNPQLKAMLAMMDEKQLERNLVEGLTNQEIVKRYIEEKNIHASNEYQEELERTIRSIRHMLNVKYFSQEFPVSVSDADAKEFYNKNKDSMPQLLLSRGGIEAKGVPFQKLEEAKKFLAQANQAGGFDKAVQTANVADKVKDFRLVNKQSLGIDAELRDSILDIAQAPTTKLFSLKDGTHWVVFADKKEDAQYRPFEQVKNDLKQYLEKEKRVERFDQEISRLKQEYRVLINEDYFTPEQTAEVPNGAMSQGNETGMDQPVATVNQEAPHAARAA
jgi:hypothetical protein